MKNFEQKAKFQFSYEELYQKSYALISLMERDLVEFEKLNLGNEQLVAFQVKVESYNNILYDEELLNEVMLRTKAKQMLAESLREVIKSIAFKAELRWGRQDVKFRPFNKGSISKMKDLELSNYARLVARMAEKFLPELKSVGLTFEEIEDLSELQELFVVSMDRIYIAQTERDIATQERVIQANVLYDNFRRIRMIGKMIWETRDEARYNDYARLITYVSVAQDEAEDEEIELNNN